MRVSSRGRTLKQLSVTAEARVTHDEKRRGWKIGAGVKSNWRGSLRGKEGEELERGLDLEGWN
jgi:hypothetical protein